MFTITRTVANGPRARRASLFTTGMVAVLAAASGTALAQEQPDELIVRGYRESLDRALDLKRSEAGASDSILAEDIADFPDLNLAESLQRIPGVSIARDAGEGRNVTVRGLGPAFTRIRINGMEGLTTAGGTDSSGGTNRDRGFDFNIFASELFSNLTVRKTSAAEIDEGSLGATIDLRTPRPFDYEDDLVMAAALQGGYNDLSSDASPRATVLFSNRTEDGRFGGLFSLAYAERSLLEEGHSTVRWQNGNLTCPVCDALATPAERTAANLAVDQAFTPRIPRYGILEHDLERLGLTGSLQFRPSDRTELVLDLMYADLDSTRSENFLEAPDFSAGGAGGRAGMDVVAYQIDNRNNLIAATFNDVDIRSEARFDELETKFEQVTLSLEHEISDALRLGVLVGTSKSDHDNPVQTTLLFDRIDVDGYAYDYSNDRLPLITYPFNVTDPASYTLTQIRLRPQTAENTFDNVELDLAWDLNDQLTLKGGLSFKEYDFVTTELRRSNGTTANLEGNVTPAAGTPLSQYSRLVSIGDAWDMPSGSTLTWLIPDVERATAMFNLSSIPLGPEPSLGNNRAVTEENNGIYLQLDFNAMLGSLPLRGNIGARYVETEQISTGYQLSATTPLLVTVSRDYDDVLPSVNFVLDLTDDLLLRLGYAQVITRPGLGNLTPGGTISVSGNNRTVTSGNPYLDPFSADATDLALEWYFADGSLLGLALFHKNIKTFPQSVAVTQPFTGNSAGLPDSVAIAACGNVVGCTPAADWVFTTPFNSDGGDLDGYEISYQQAFGNGLGLIANYTYVESKIAYIDPAGPNGISVRDLIGLSEDAYNATIYYEADRFSVRASASYRDGFLGTVPGRNGNDVEGTNETFNVDLAATFSVTDKLELTLEGINLTDRENDQFVDSFDRVFVFHHTGREYFIGVRYSLR